MKRRTMMAQSTITTFTDDAPSVCGGAPLKIERLTIVSTSTRRYITLLSRMTFIRGTSWHFAVLPSHCKRLVFLLKKGRRLIWLSAFLMIILSN